MSRDEKEIAKQYLEDNKISQLLGRLTTLLILHKPDNPRQFIVDTLKNNPKLEQLPLLDDKEIETMFKMLENPIYSGEINGHQITTTLNTMGIKHDTIDPNATFNFKQFKALITKAMANY